jgi:hypothetical protein
LINLLNFKSFSNELAQEKFFDLQNDEENFFCYKKGTSEELRALLNPIVEASRKTTKTYTYDLSIGILLYDLLPPDRFPLRYSADDGVWKFLSIDILPDVVYLRYGDNPERYWKTSRRIWLKTLWWYIHLSWQGNTHKTFEAIRNLTTDEVVQLVERSGSSGYRVELYREIMKQVSVRMIKNEPSRKIFRALMKLNTAKIFSIEPELTENGLEGYVSKLFSFFEIDNNGQ